MCKSLRNDEDEEIRKSFETIFCLFLFLPPALLSFHTTTHFILPAAGMHFTQVLAEKSKYIHVVERLERKRGERELIVVKEAAKSAPLKPEKLLSPQTASNGFNRI